MRIKAPPPVGLATVARLGRRSLGVAGGVAGDVAAALEELAGDALVRGVEQTLAWEPTRRAVDLALRSPAAEQAVDSALAGPVMDAFGRGAARPGVAERIAAPLLERPDLARALGLALDDARVAAVLAQLLDSEATGRLVDRVFASRVIDDVVERLLASEELWMLVARIAESPTVTDAMMQSSRGLADEVGEQVRTRSRGADAWLERTARRFGRHGDDGADGAPARLATGEP
jgi:hypothetical protein